MNRTLYDKLVDAHKVCDLPDDDMLIYVDFHIMNEYTSPQAFSGLDHKGLGVRRPEAHLAVVDHVNATRQRDPHDEASRILKGRKVAEGVNAIIVPGSTYTRLQAKAEGLDRVFREAGFDWRPESGCSMCLAMNDDIAMDGERLASSTNRNFEGRQGQGARTHLMGPAMVAAAAISGHLADVRSFASEET